MRDTARAGFGRTLLVTGAALAHAFVLLLLPQQVRAQQVAADECCTTLLLPTGARALSLGRALTARAGADALFLNPAAIASVARSEIRVHTERSDFSKATAISAFFGIGAVGVAALTFSMYDYGEYENTDEFGNTLGSSTSADQVLAVSFGTAVVSGMEAGITYKLFHWQQTCVALCGTEAVTATAQLVDAGLRLAPGWSNSLELGLAVLNVGPALQVKNADQADPTPARVRAGAAYEVLQHFPAADSTMQLVLSFDASTGLRSTVEPQFGGGAELILDRALFVRGGYSSGTGVGTGASIGVGLLYDRFDIGVAKSFGANDIATAPFQITFAIRL